MNTRRKVNRRNGRSIRSRTRYNEEKTKKEKILLLLYKQTFISLCFFMFLVGLKVMPFTITKFWINNIKEQISHQIEWNQVYSIVVQIPTFKTWVEEQWGQESVIEGSVDEIKEGKEHDQQDEEKEYLDTNVDMWNNYEENMHLDMDDIEKSLGK